MKRRVAPADLDQPAMLQRSKFSFLLALMALVFGVSGASAGDRSLLNVIGYSENGRYFAFEEYGIQDGSGFAYSNIYLIDLNEDRWVVGTPVRLRADDEVEKLSDIREQAHQEIQPRLQSLDVTEPAQILAFTGDGEVGVDDKQLGFGIPDYLKPGAVREPYTIKLGMFDTTSSTTCEEWFSETPLGFSLSLQNGDLAREVYRDGNLPRSRGCPIDYRITGVFLPMFGSDIERAVALISVYSFGFEGPDRRFVAVPIVPVP